MQIRWTELAAKDLTEICDYIHDHSGADTARRIATAIYNGIANLSQFPHQGRIGRKAGTR